MAFRAAMLDFAWSNYVAAAEMAGHAAPLQASLLVKAAALVILLPLKTSVPFLI